VSSARRCLALLVAMALLTLTGCVSLPTTGPIEKVEGLEPACQSCVNVDVAPPQPGGSKLDVVRGFLLANANYQAGYTVAKQYLTRSAAERWSPEDSVTIYSDPPQAEDGQVVLNGRFVGFLDKDLSFTTQARKFKYAFDLVQEDGEWRIGTPFPGLLIQQDAFTSRYTAYNLYFPGSAGALVPDPIYLPPLRNPAIFASSLVKALLDGPSKWLAPAVETAVPEGTSLSVGSVTIANGTAEVPLSGPGLQQLDDAGRSLLAAQLVYTLKQVATVQNVLLLDDSVPYRVPQSDPRGLAIPVREISPELDPIPVEGTEQPLHAVQDGAVVRVSANADVPQVEKVAGGLGSGRYRVDSLAVSGTGNELAVVTDRGTRLRRSAAEGATPTRVLSGVTSLLRPQITRTGAIWAIGQRKGRQRLWTVVGDQAVEVKAPVLAEGRVRAFRVSPDGSRIALLVRNGTRTRLFLALVQRTGSDSVAVVDGRELDVRQGVVGSTSSASSNTTVHDMRDVSWSGATTLLVLAASGDQGPYVLTEVSQDASSVQSEPAVGDWEPEELTVLLRTGTTVVQTDDQRAFRDEGQQWRPLLTRVTAVAYPG